MSDADGRGYACVRIGLCEISVPSSQVWCKPKVALKKKKILETCAPPTPLRFDILDIISNKKLHFLTWNTCGKVLKLMDEVLVSKN